MKKKVFDVEVVREAVKDGQKHYESISPEELQEMKDNGELKPDYKLNQFPLYLFDFEDMLRDSNR